MKRLRKTTRKNEILKPKVKNIHLREKPAVVSTFVHWRVSENESQFIKSEADKLGLTVSSFMRFVLKHYKNEAYLR